ncbi:uncharacterized protein OCT59_021232 [Rhizophagus irregularis]|nr:concanavalin A-like lectin/glucanase domain-containing protein [Rhizophagus irregularis DAOM 181602=DAOM 197198]POG81478.1 concanavalin A-like lectin/glucanase domain-containing protein [Rhizophagus irregularis DAOM 181602=DAOM 197198]UZO02753.1 hypothetical protein OCT59_021232 [Rhizophagus irregularis]|eukprot:XP_025188344.1 concanavalin A-like lectin/glucanase domain-containing protein [Rhizophagus irregularis DAOM 181602=DAOM 197198]
MRGISLEQDLRLLINNPKYSDIEILCKDEKKLYGCRAILAARSEVFDKLIYNGMKESCEKQISLQEINNNISLPEINSIGMEIVLEYIYTGSIKEEFLTKDNIIEAFYAANYFQLTELQDFITKTSKNAIEKNFKDNDSPELLSKFVEKNILTENSNLQNLLVEAVATIPLNIIEFGRLSITGLQYLLSCTSKERMPFATPEYEVLRYSVILVAKQVSNDAYKTFMERLPTLEKLEQIKNPRIENKFMTQKVAKELEPLVKFIDFMRIEGQILVDIIEPLEIISPEIIFDVYRQKTRLSKSDLNNIRGIPIPTCVWDESECGASILIEENGKIACLQEKTDSWRNVRAKMILEDNGIFEWDVIVEKAGSDAWVGVCASENLNYGFWAGRQPTGWVLGIKGIYRTSDKGSSYCPPFGDGAIITVHMDMNKRTCAFTVNGTRYQEVSEWNNLPSKLYPVVSLGHFAKLRIQPHRKNG